RRYDQARLRPDDVLGRRGVRQRREERRQGRGDRDHGGIGLTAALVQEDAGREKQRRPYERESDAGLHADPTAVDRDDEEEDDADEDRQAADDCEDAAAEEVLEGLARAQ